MQNNKDTSTESQHIHEQADNGTQAYYTPPTGEPLQPTNGTEIDGAQPSTGKENGSSRIFIGVCLAIVAFGAARYFGVFG
jgi:hypothetical protein